MHPYPREAMDVEFHLEIATDPQSFSAELRLLDAHGNQVAYRHTDFDTIPATRREALFGLRDYLRYYVEPGEEEQAVRDTGVCIAEQVLGDELFRALWEPRSQRTLRIALPAAGAEGDRLAALLARVPWEIARPGFDQPSLAERHLLVRVVHHGEPPLDPPLPLEGDEPLRVLFVFAEAPGSRPLAARRERQALERLLTDEVYPGRRVVGHFLTHGVTRERLASQFEEQGGYHVVHWSGHGHRNLLELTSGDGAPDRISGEELLDLCGGHIPNLVVLSACHSGDILRVRDWAEFRAVAEGREDVGEPPREAGAARDLPIEERPGFTGTAHALLRGGVPAVVAMRYAVGDAYARELALELYRALFAQQRPKPVAAALNQARRALLDPAHPAAARFAACDHATPLLYGGEAPPPAPAEGRSPALTKKRRRLHAVAELTAAGHPNFAGRSDELARLGAGFIGSAAAGPEVRPVALLTGLAGMGKTALAAEALALWESRFDRVLLYQAKPNPLPFDDWLRDLHLKLFGELRRYHDHVQRNPADAIHRPADDGFTGEARRERLVDNLLRALQDEAILLVLDNFETQLKPNPDADGRWACQDPAWERCLARLAEGLPGSRSRVLLTCRHPLAALAGGALHLPLGPLSAGEAALYLREHESLGPLLFGGDADELRLAERLLRASRFHPLLMDRLGRLAAGGAALRPQLLKAIAALERGGGLDDLPDLFAPRGEDAREAAYLADALTGSIDRLLEAVGAEARRLLWVVALANEPVEPGLLAGVWSGESHEQGQLRALKAAFERFDQLPPGARERLRAMPDEVRAAIEALPPEPTRPDPGPLLERLTAVGLLSGSAAEPGATPALTCHELVRERVRAWMDGRPDERADLDADTLRLAYAERLEAVFHALRHQDLEAALAVGSRALVYTAQAGAWERLAGFAGAVVTGSADPRLVEALLPHLAAAARGAPEGRLRWVGLAQLADGLQQTGRPDAALAHYAEAASLARVGTEQEGLAGRQAWSDLGVINRHWGHALAATGDLDRAHRCHVEATKAKQKADGPAVAVVAADFEALRIDIIQGKADEALPEVEKHLSRVRGWWERRQAGEPVADAPDREMLARTYIAALDVAREGYTDREEWGPALQHIDEQIAVERALGRPERAIAQERFNRATVLIRRGDLAEAQRELEACLALFEGHPGHTANVYGALASLFHERGDTAGAMVQERRALAIRNQLPDPGDRAISHNNLANYLDRGDAPPEAGLHRLASLAYRAAAGLGQHLRTSIHNYAVLFHRARAGGTEAEIPRLADLLADPAFEPLARWLRERQIDPEELQSVIDHLLTEVREAALSDTEDRGDHG